MEQQTNLHNVKTQTIRTGDNLHSQALFGNFIPRLIFNLMSPNILNWLSLLASLSRRNHLLQMHKTVMGSQHLMSILLC